MPRTTTPSSAPRTRARPGRAGYTLTEILVVIGLIVLLIAISVPVLNVLTGNRSTEAAENQVSSYLGDARAQAVALQKNIGVLFFRDPASQRTTLAQVELFPLNGNAIDRLPDRDFLTLQNGTGIQLLNDDQTGGSGQRDRYRRLGLILFDPRGQLTSIPFQIFNNSAIGQAINIDALISAEGGSGISYPVTPPLYSQVGFVVYDDDAFSKQGFSPEEGRSTPREQEENAWLDANAVPLIVNRYNGTLIRGE